MTKKILIFRYLLRPFTCIDFYFNAYNELKRFEMHKYINATTLETSLSPQRILGFDFLGFKARVFRIESP